MGLFGPSKSSRLIEQLQAQINQMASIIQTRGITVFPNYSTTEHADRYCSTDDIHAIVKLVAQTAATIPIYTYIKTKDGLIDAPEDCELALLLEMPFEGLSAFESLYMVYATRLIFGECVIYKERPELGPNKGKVVRLHYLEPQSMNIRVSDSWPRKILSWEYAPEGHVIMTDIPPTDIIHTKYFNPKVTFTGNELRGLSPLSVLKKRLTRVDSNNDVATAQLQNGGVPGIVYDKSPGATPEIATLRRNNFFKYLTQKENKGAPYFTSNDLGYIELGLKLADLQVADLEKIDFKKLCNVFNVSTRLFNDDGAGSENSDTNAREALYTNAVLPEVRSLVDCLNINICHEFKDARYKLKADFSEIQELQKNVEEMARAFAALPIMMPKQILEAFNLEVDEDENLDKVYIKQGYTLLSDLSMGDDDLEETGDYAKPAK